jgi:hypothetical protein
MAIISFCVLIGVSAAVSLFTALAECSRRLRLP